jgi:hypothetical protein
MAEDEFVPSLAQLAGAAATATALVATAGWLARTPPRRPARRAGASAVESRPSGRRVPPDRAAPPPPRVALAAIAATLLFVAGAAQVGSALVVVAAYLALVLSGVTAVRRWSTRPGWSPRHRLALAAGALVPHLAFALAQRSLVEVPVWLDLVGDLLFTAGAAALVLAGWRTIGRAAVPILGRAGRQRGRTTPPTGDGTERRSCGSQVVEIPNSR